MPSPPSTSDLLQLSQAVRGTFKRRRAASAGPLSVLPAASVAVSAPLVAVCAAARSTTLLCSAVVRYLRFGGSAIGDERMIKLPFLLNTQVMRVLPLTYCTLCCGTKACHAFLMLSMFWCVWGSLCRMAASYALDQHMIHKHSKRMTQNKIGPPGSCPFFQRRGGESSSRASAYL